MSASEAVENFHNCGKGHPYPGRTTPPPYQVKNTGTSTAGMGNGY